MVWGAVSAPAREHWEAHGLLRSVAYVEGERPRIARLNRAIAAARGRTVLVVRGALLAEGDLSAVFDRAAAHGGLLAFPIDVGGVPLPLGPRPFDGGVRTMRNLDRFRIEAFAVDRDRHAWAGGLDERFETPSAIVGRDYAARLRRTGTKIASCADLRLHCEALPEAPLETRVQHANLYAAAHGALPHRERWMSLAARGLVRLRGERVTLRHPSA